MRKLILTCDQSPGDVVMLTAAVRELHLAHPGKFQTDVRTTAGALWDNNPYLTRLDEGSPGVEVLRMHYPAIHSSNSRPYHFIHGYTQYLEEVLGVRLPISKFYGDVHLSAEEKASPVPGQEHGVPERFWIVVAGGKRDFTAKWWNPQSFQKVVDHFQGKLTLVQCGEEGHWHPPLENVVNLVGKTTTREFMRLMYHAEGVICPVTFAMHLAAAVECQDGTRGTRPCVVLAGGREPAHWEAYPNHQFLSTNGTLSCCRQGGCWKSRCQLVGDGDLKDRQDLCEQPVQVTPELRIARCLEMIRADDVIRRVEWYLEVDGLAKVRQQTSPAPTFPVAEQPAPPQAPPPEPTSPRTCCPNAAAKRNSQKKFSVAFYHGLGDCAYFAHLIPLYAKRGYEIAVECTPDKGVLFRAAGASVLTRGAEYRHDWGYPPGGSHEGHGRFWQGSKIGHNISQHPLPDIGSKDQLWQELIDVQLDVSPFLGQAAIDQAEKWLATLPQPITLLHSKGNTDPHGKNLPDEVTEKFYREFLDQCDGSLVLLDWDNRVPRLASYRIRHLDSLGACSLETLLALQARADLMIGVDSGPLHAARFTKTPKIGLWMPRHYASTYTLPLREQLNVVLADYSQQWNKYKRVPWNIVDLPGQHFRAVELARLTRQMLDSSRYLANDDRAADVQLQHFVHKCRGVGGNALSAYCDRHRSFDVLLREMARRSTANTVVETGCIRAEEDWAGAGFFTYLMAAYLTRAGGKLFSVDLNPQHCEFARSWTSVFGGTVEVTAEDSIKYLQRFDRPIDVLYLDSLDTTELGHQEHGLKEAQVALPHLHAQSLIVFDDTPWSGCSWVGKGAQAIPWLLSQGWEVLYGGYQVILQQTKR